MRRTGTTVVWMRAIICVQRIVCSAETSDIETLLQAQPNLDRSRCLDLEMPFKEMPSVMQMRMEIYIC